MSLVLSRKPDQAVILYTSDGPIRVRVLWVEGRIKLAVDAPSGVLVLREELAKDHECKRVELT